MTNFEILPVFPSVISANKINEDISTLWKHVETLTFFRSNADDTHLVYSSNDMQILNSMPDIKKILLEYFYEFKDTVLKLSTTEFDITTSWITKTEPGGFCQYHAHKNAYYSGVLYPSKTNSPGSGELLFTDVGIKNETILINDPTEWNLLNSRRIVIEPDTNLLVFFPSSLRHRISKYTGTENRYSLAFNLFPLGSLGSGDSSINLKKL
jgi:uncharacterized protein (TIGR02466 family)